MYIEYEEADKKLINLLSCVSRDPLSWKGWSCLHIDLSEIDEDQKGECFLWIKSIVDSYLKDIEGHLYACRDLDVHIICKNTAYEILQQAAHQICDLAKDESDSRLHFQIYNLTNETSQYTQTVLNKIGKENKTGGTVGDFFFPVPIPFLANQSGVTVTPLKKIKVLLVEDDPVVRWMVRNTLKNDCDFVTATTAGQAFSLYGSYQPDIVFLDIGLPDKSGRSVLEWIMRNDPGACVVMFSANNNIDNIVGAFEEGASGFIAKPFIKESLLHYIHLIRDIKLEESS